MQKHKIVFCHGFLFNSLFFNNLKNHLIEHFECIDMDLGYQNKKDIPSSSICDNAIAVGHDLGLLKLMQLGYNFSYYVGISSFLHYVNNVVATRLLTNFEYAFNIDPMEAIVTHIRRLDLQDLSAIKSINVLAIKESLEELRTLNFEHMIKNHKKISFLHGAKDTFYPMLEIKKYENKYNIITNSHAGYALGYTDTEWCAKKIKEIVTKI